MKNDERNVSRISGPLLPVDMPSTVVGALRERAALCPGKPAVVYRDYTITYAGFDRATDAIAAWLLEQGIHSQDRVGLLVSRCELVPLGIFGILKAGAAYVPMDPAYPQKRLSYMAEDSGMKYILTEDKYLGLLPGAGGQMTDLREVIKESEWRSAHHKELPQPQPNDLMEVSYTSGSTGKPKGVMLEHRNVLPFAMHYAMVTEMTEQDAVSSYLSYSFIAHYNEYFPAFITGAALHIIDDAIRLDAAAVNRYFHDNNIAVAVLPTAFGRQFAMTQQNSSLRCLSVIGEMLSPIESMPSCYAVYNLYGSTECASAVTMGRVHPGQREISIGTPADGLEVYVVGENGEIVPRGKKGELCVSGQCVSRGYRNLPERTASVFVDNPFNTNPGYERMYRTGDVFKCTPDGELIPLGRGDYQVKVRGFRIELSEIDCWALRYPGVREAVTVAVDGPDGEKRLITYLAGQEKTDSRLFQRFVGENLPPYMVPSAVVHLDKIPRNLNGKIDRQNLPPLEMQAEQQSAQMTQTEEKICRIVAGFLKVEPSVAGLDADLMYLGLHSLLAGRIAAEIQDELGIEILAVEILQHPTVREIAGLAANAAPQKSVEDCAAVEVYYPLSPNQLGGYLEWKKSPGGVQSNISKVYFFPPQTDAQKLRRATAAAVDAHPLMKGVIEEVDSSPMWRRRDDVKPEVALRRVSKDEFENLRNNWIKPFDMQNGPLYRLTVCEIPGTRTALLLDIHHAVFDGTSLNIVMQDIVSAYNGAELQREKWTGFDQSREDYNKRQGDAWSRTLKYYTERLAAFSGPTLLPGQKKPDKPVGSPQYIHSSPINADRVRKFCASNGLTPNSVFLCCLSFLLGVKAGDKKVLLATLLSGRETARARATVGMLIKSLPIFVDADMDLNVVEACHCAEKSIVSAMRHDSFSLLDLKTHGKLKTAPVFYIYHGALMDENLMLDGCEISSEFVHAGGNVESNPIFPFECIVSEEGAQFVVTLKYNDALFEAPELEEFLGEMATLIEKMAKNPYAQMSQLLESK